MTEPVVSIIIPTFNRNELLKYGLTSISKQVTAFPYEIIILNEYIDDESSILAKQFNARYIITRPEMTKETVSWRCPGYAINHGVKQAKGEYIIIACPEIFHLNPTNIQKLINPLIMSNDKIITYTDGVDDSGNLLNSLRTNVQDSVLPMTVGNRPLNTKFPFFMAMRKADFISVGGYEERFQQGFAFDDTNFSKRLENNGFQYIKVEGKIVHIFHPRLRYNLPEIQRLWKINEALYIELINQKIANEGVEWGNFGH